MMNRWNNYQQQFDNSILQDPYSFSFNQQLFMDMCKHDSF